MGAVVIPPECHINSQITTACRHGTVGCVVRHTLPRPMAEYERQHDYQQKKMRPMSTLIVVIIAALALWWLYEIAAPLWSST